jgi:hypothetical protein
MVHISADDSAERRYHRQQSPQASRSTALSYVLPTNGRAGLPVGSQRDSQVLYP